jgi:lipoprotein-anchoring transpeptidase ErfK/SrfK
MRYVPEVRRALIGARHRSSFLAAVSVGLAAMVVVAGLSACAGSSSTPGAAPTTVAAVVLPTVTGKIIPTPTDISRDFPTTVAGSVGKDGYSDYQAGVAVVARLNKGLDEIKIFSDATSKTPTQTLKRKTSELVFVAKGNTPDRLYVHLPVRPNGSMGWIDKSNVELASNPFSIEIELSTFTLRAYENGKISKEIKIGIGRDEVPTPEGYYYTIYVATPPVKNGTYGDYVIGLSGFSEVLKTFNGGQGRLGIHGTNHPELIGTKASHGCIRLTNEDVDYLVERLPLGTPVKIIA